MKHTLFSAIAGGKIEEGILRGVSVITIGEAKNHDLYVDAETLKTLLSAAQNRPGGVPVKMDHGTGFYQIVGKLENFRIEGDSLRADLHLVKKHDAYERILEMAATMAESFGLSASFERKDEKIDGKTFIRCLDLYSVDLVDVPAANPNGLFRAPVDSPADGMAENQKIEGFFSGLKTWLGEKENTELASTRTELSTARADLAAKEKQVTELTAQIATFKTDLAAKEKEIAELKAAQSDFDVKVKAEASKEAQKITASLGIPPISQTPAPNPAAPQKTELTGLEKTKAAFAAQLKPSAL